MRTSAISILNHSFTDFDELTEAVRSWDLEFRQLEGGTFRGSISQFVGDGFQFAHARFRRRLEQLGSPPRGLRTFAIPANPSLRLFWRGEAVQGNQIMAFPRGSELNAVSNAGFDIYTLSVSDEILANRTDEAGLPDFPDLIGEREVFDSDTGAMGDLRELCQVVRRRIEKDPGGPKVPALEQELVSDLSGTLLAALTISIPVPAPPPPRLRSAALRKSLEFIRGHSSDPVTVRDLVGLSGASWRTLDYAFRERFGITPKEYLRTGRLNGVHKDLHRADLSSTKITDIANRWGFWHMGQFAADYRRLFGELPSHTLKRSTGL